MLFLLLYAFVETETDSSGIGFDYAVRLRRVLRSYKSRYFMSPIKLARRQQVLYYTFTWKSLRRVRCEEDFIMQYTMCNAELFRVS